MLSTWIKQYGVAASAHAKNRAWKYRLEGELYTISFSSEHSGKSWNQVLMIQKPNKKGKIRLCLTAFAGYCSRWIPSKWCSLRISRRVERLSEWRWLDATNWVPQPLYREIGWTLWSLFEDRDWYCDCLWPSIYLISPQELFQTLRKGWQNMSAMKRFAYRSLSGKSQRRRSLEKRKSLSLSRKLHVVFSTSERPCQCWFFWTSLTPFLPWQFKWVIAWHYKLSTLSPVAGFVLFSWSLFVRSSLCASDGSAPCSPGTLEWKPEPRYDWAYRNLTCDILRTARRKLRLSMLFHPFSSTVSIANTIICVYHLLNGAIYAASHLLLSPGLCSKIANVRLLLHA